VLRAFRFGSGCIVVFGLVTSLAAQSTAKLVSKPPLDELLATSNVSAPLIAGVMLSAPQAPKPQSGPWLALVGTGEAGQSRVCVTVKSLDGRYRAEDVEYELPAPAAGPVVLPFESVIRHADFVGGLSPDSVAVLARPGACQPANTELAVPVIWREPAPASAARRLRIAYMSGGRDATVSWAATADEKPTVDPTPCRKLTGTTFDTWCELTLPPNAPRRIVVTIQSYRQTGRPLEPTRLTVAIGR